MMITIIVRGFQHILRLGKWSPLKMNRGRGFCRFGTWRVLVTRVFLPLGASFLTDIRIYETYLFGFIPLGDDGVWGDEVWGCQARLDSIFTNSTIGTGIHPAITPNILPAFLPSCTLTFKLYLAMKLYLDKLEDHKCTRNLLWRIYHRPVWFIFYS